MQWEYVFLLHRRYHCGGFCPSILKDNRNDKLQIVHLYPADNDRNPFRSPELHTPEAFPWIIGDKETNHTAGDYIPVARRVSFNKLGAQVDVVKGEHRFVDIFYTQYKQQCAYIRGRSARITPVQPHITIITPLPIPTLSN